jgi:SAM-dependent methyltransferase
MTNTIAIAKQGPEHRVQVMRDMFSARDLGLEIGPSFRPVAPKARGYTVETVDHATADELREKYKGKPIEALQQIEDVDYVWRGGSLVDLIGSTERYGYIVASHVIEHTTDIVRFLKDCEALLKPDGVLVLAVPDKRFCFDFFRPVSTTGDAVAAYLEKRDRHSVTTIFNHFTLLARNGAIGSWDKDNPPSDLRFIFNPDNGMRSLEAARRSGDYLDAHAWQFTPSSFLLMLSDLRDIGLLGLHEHTVIDGRSCEFFVALKKTARYKAASRLELAKAALIEQAEIAQKVADGWEHE